MIIIEGAFRITELARARQPMEAMIEASRTEPGCIDYAYAIDLMDPSLVRVSERWENRQALDAHLKSDHIRAWRAAWADIGASGRDLRMYEAEPEDF